MRKFVKGFKTLLLLGVPVLALVLGTVLLNVSPSAGTVSAAVNPWGGRDNNYVTGTGFTEPGSRIGAELTEPAYQQTWLEHFGFATLTYTQLDSLSYEEGNFRKNPENEVSGVGTSWEKAWQIENVQQLTYFVRLTQVMGWSTTYIRDVYAQYPYFRLTADIDLAGYRWIAPYFIKTDNTMTITTSKYALRFYFDAGIYNGVGELTGTHTISNAYVSQTANGTLYLTTPSIFGNLPRYSQIKNVGIKNAYVTADNLPTSTNEVSFIGYSADGYYTNIKVENSVIRGSRNLHGIAYNAAVIEDCTLENCTFISTINYSNWIYANGMGSAARYDGNKLLSTSIEIGSPTYASRANGMGLLRALTSTFYDIADGEYKIKPAYVLSGLALPTEDRTHIIPGFYSNTVENSKITVHVNGGTSYGHAFGIGQASLSGIKPDFVGNTVSNSLVSVKSENNNTAGSESLVAGIGYVSGGLSVRFTDNTVSDSTLQAVNYSGITSVSGISQITGTIIADIENCLVDNCDIKSGYTKYVNTSYLATYAAGINLGFARLIKNCVVSGNIEAINEKHNIFVYGIGSTLGKGTLTGAFSATTYATNPYYRKNWGTDAANDPNTWYSFDGDKGEDLRKVPFTRIENCYNFANITTSSTASIYTCGIGMAEGFTNCYNYGDLMGNSVGGIAFGFNGGSDTVPNLYNTGATATYSGGLRPLVIDRCANYGSLIKSANNVASYIGGMFAYYYNTLNYRRVSGGDNTYETLIENLDGKYVSVTDCISAGEYYFYNYNADNDNYELKETLSEVSMGTVYWGSLFGRLYVLPYSFTAGHPNNAEGLEDYLTDTFVFENNLYKESASEFDMETEQVTNSAYRVYAVNPETGEANTTNKTGWDYLDNYPAAYNRQLVFGVITGNNALDPVYADEMENLTGENLTGTWSAGNAIVKDWEENALKPFNDFSDGVNEDVDWGEWNTDSGIPQIAIPDYPFQTVVYNKGSVESGFVPSVSVKRFADSDSLDFDVKPYQRPEIGRTVTWEDTAGEAVGSKVTVTRETNGSFPVKMLFASQADTPYHVVLKDVIIDNGDNGADYQYTAATPITKGGTINATVTLNQAGIEVTAVAWYAVVNGIEYEIHAEEESEEVPFDTVEMPNVYKHTLDEIVLDESFITNYSYYSEANGRFEIELKAVFLSVNIHTVNIDIPNLITTGVAPGLTVNVDRYTEDTAGLTAVHGSVITLTAVYDTMFYDFITFNITGNYQVVSGGDITLPTVSFEILGDIESISFTLTERRYNVVVVPCQVDGSELSVEDIVTNPTQQIYLGGEVTGLTAVSLYEDVNEQRFYKFVRWGFMNGAQLAGNSFAVAATAVGAETLKLNLQEIGGETVFAVTAVYQLQYKITVNMHSGVAFDGDVSTYKIFQGNTELTVTDNSVIVNENILLRAVFYPDSRLGVDEIDGIKVRANGHPEYINNTLYINTAGFREIDVLLAPRPAKVTLRNHKSHEDPSFSSPGGLGIAALEKIAPNEEALDVNYKEVFHVAFDTEINADQYRLIGLYFKNLDGGFVYAGGLDADGRVTIDASDEFFKNYVDMSGNCELWVFVALVYDVNISAPNFTREGDTFKYSDGYGNSFTLSFVTNDPEDSDAVREKGISRNDYIVDYGVKIEYLFSEGFGSYYNTNLSEAEQENKSVTVTSARSLSFTPEQFNLTVIQEGKSNAKIDSYNITFGVGDTISIALSVQSAYQINGATLNGKSLAELGAVRKGNTVTVEVTPDFIRAVNSGFDSDVELTMGISTGISSGILYGGIGGGTVVIILAALAVFLTIRSKRINEKRKKAEALAKEYEKRFNIGSVIADLKK